METTVNKRSGWGLSEGTRKILIDMVCYLFVLLFLYAATSKLLEYDKFLLQMSKSPIITDYSHILVWMVPTVEIIISIAFFIERTKTIALFASFALMCLFTAYIYAILNFADNIPCSCGGVLQQMTWNQHLIFNIVFVLLAVVGVLLQSKSTEKKTH